MSTKFTKKTSKAHVYLVGKRGSEGVYIEFRYYIEGTKHRTHVTHTMQISLCDMKRIGERFQETMDELLHEWRKTKGAISGTAAPDVKVTPSFRT